MYINLFYKKHYYNTFISLYIIEIDYYNTSYIIKIYYYTTLHNKLY